MARQKVQKAVIGFLCLCTVLMFSMNFTCPEIDNTYGWLYSVLENLRLSINKDMFQLTIYWGALFYCNLKLLKMLWHLRIEFNTCIILAFFGKLANR